MHIVLGGTGRVGSALARALLSRGERVTIVTRDRSKAARWEASGAAVAVLDVLDTEALRALFRTGRRAFLLNPPADPATDTVVEEKKTMASIVAALDGAGLEKAVVQSTYGAHAGEGAGDLNVLHELERGAARFVPTSVIRAAYYLSNWDGALETARENGLVYAAFPGSFVLPMVAPHDLGAVAARLMTEPPEQGVIHHVEGPERYSPDDVAAAFAAALGRNVEAVSTPRDQLQPWFESRGFSKPAARSYAAMTAFTLDRPDYPANPERGTTSLTHYVAHRAQREVPKSGASS